MVLTFFSQVRLAQKFVQGLVDNLFCFPPSLCKSESTMKCHPWNFYNLSAWIWQVGSSARSTSVSRANTRRSPRCRRWSAPSSFSATLFAPPLFSRSLTRWHRTFQSGKTPNEWWMSWAAPWISSLPFFRAAATSLVTISCRCGIVINVASILRSESHPVWLISLNGLCFMSIDRSDSTNIGGLKVGTHGLQTDGCVWMFRSGMFSLFSVPDFLSLFIFFIFHPFSSYSSIFSWNISIEFDVLICSDGFYW